jgi:prophage regulatory protein
MKRLIKLPEVERRTGLSRSTIYAMAAAGQFPRPIKLIPNGRASGWLEDEVDEVFQRAIDRRPVTVDAA